MFIWILMALLILGLVGFGIGGFTSGSQRNVGSVGDTKISIEDYGRQLDRTIQNVSNQLGRNLTQAEIAQSGIQQSILSEMFATAALDNEATNLGISVGDEVVRDEVVATPSFNSLTGEFDTQAYQFALERAGLTSAEYEESIRTENARAILQGSVLSGLASDQTAARAFVAYAAEKRDFDWVELTAEDLDAPVAAPSEDEITEFYELNPEMYTAPLTRDLTYVWLAPESLADQVEITDEELKEAYEINSERYNRPARRLFDRIIFADQAEAEAARSQLDALTTDFDALAEARGLSIDDIDQGEKERSQLPPAVGDLIFEAAEPGIIGPVQTDLGPALYRINAIFDEHITPFEEVEEELREELASEHTSVLVLNMLPEIDDMLAAGATLEELAADTELELYTMSFTDDTEEGIAAYDEFREAAQQAVEGDFPEIATLSDGGIFALRLDKITPPARIPLEEVHDKVVEDWTADATLKALRELAQNYADKLSEISDFASLGLTATSVENVARTGFVEGTPPSLVAEVFGAETGSSVIVDDLTSVYLARVTAVHATDLTSDENQQTLNRISQQLDLQIAQDVQNAYARALQDQAGITVNQNMVDAVNTQIFTGRSGG